MDESFLTTEEVLDYLQVNLRTVYRLIKAGKIPAVRVGRQWRFRKRDIDAWLESQRPRGRSPRRRRRAPRPRRRRAGRPRVLVVDDEASIRDLLSKTLALAEYDVDLAPDGRTALERLRIIPYDLADHRPEDAGGRRPHGHPRGAAAQGRHPGDHHHRVLDRSQRDRGGQSRRLRLPDQAVPRPARPRRRRQGARRITRCIYNNFGGFVEAALNIRLTTTPTEP